MGRITLIITIDIDMMGLPWEVFEQEVDCKATSSLGIDINTDSFIDYVVIVVISIDVSQNTR